MKQTRVVGVPCLHCALLLAALLLAACMQPVQIVAPDSTTIPPVTDVPAAPAFFGDEAMCSSLFDLNLEHTAEVLQSHLFWTWHVNFNEPPPAMIGADFYGCLHFFWRAQVAPEVVFEPAAFHVLTPCTAVGTLVAVPEPNLQSSNGLPRAGNRVDFADGAYIACAFDLGAAADAYLASQPLQEETDALAAASGMDAGEVFDAIQAELLALGGAQSYKTFSMASATGEFMPDAEGAPLPEHAILYYQPNCVGIVGCPQSLGLGHVAFAGFAGDGVLPKAEILATTYTVDGEGACPNANERCFIEVPEAPHEFDFLLYTVMEYGEASNPEFSSDPCVEEGVGAFDQYLTFRYRYFGNFAPAPTDTDWQRWCASDIVPDVLDPVSPPGLQNGIPFWTGDSTILIGYNPVAEIPFNASAVEVWVDPNSSTVTPD